MQRNIQRLAPSARGLCSLATHTPPASVKSAKLVNPKAVDVSFSDGSCYRFHSLWLRDGCRDSTHVLQSSERSLEASPLVSRFPRSAGAKGVEVNAQGTSVQVEWETGSVPKSSFNAGFLRAFADVAGKQLEPTASAAKAEDWFEFIDGKSQKAKAPETLRLWRADDLVIPKFKHGELPSRRREFMMALMDPGVVIVEDMPEDREFDGSILSRFAMDYLGGLQKHPRRTEEHWTISTQEAVLPSNMLHSSRGGTNAYDTDKQLCNHTDQSLYGLPGLLLGFHCADGQGNNSLTDGFAVAYALKERKPHLFDLLSRHGMAAGRRLEYYASGPLMFDTNHRVLNTDADGNLMRVQYHESYRTPLTVPFEDFEAYFEALATFYEMVHSAEFQTHLSVSAGQLLIMNNWRTMHGRAGLKGKARTILGGTVTREAFYSAVRTMEQEELGVPPDVECGVPTAAYPYVAARPEARLRLGFDAQQRAASA